jgi:hypothetical protein
MGHHFEQMPQMDVFVRCACAGYLGHPFEDRHLSTIEQASLPKNVRYEYNQ